MSTFQMIFPDSVRQQRLLVVDDEPAVRTLWVRVLARRGYQVDAVDNGLEALQQLASAQYDVVLTDLNMPQLDGLGLLQHIRSQYPDIAVIVITAFASLDTARQALRLGAFDYLTKPLDINELERTVQTCLEVRELQRLRHERETLTEVMALLDVSRVVGATPELHTRVEAFIDQLWIRFQPQTITLSLLGLGKHTLQLYGQRGVPGLSLGDVPLPLVYDAAVLTAAHRQLVPQPPLGTDLLHVLHVQDRPVGVVQLSWPTSNEVLNDHKRRVLEIFAASMAAVLENGRLYDKLKQQSIQTVAALAAAIDARDPYTRGHSEQVMRYAVRLAETLGYDPAFNEHLRYATLLHDVGKIGIPDAILLKPAALTPAEVELMRSHTVIGENIVAMVLEDARPIVRHHHENFDGSGYPDGLAGEAIPLESRLIAVADAFDAMTSDRSYRSALPVDEALARLQRGRGRQWQCGLVDAFVSLIEQEGATLMAYKDRAAQRIHFDSGATWALHSDYAGSNDEPRD